MTPVFYAYFTSSTTSASSAGQLTAYIFTMFSFGLAVETTFERTSSRSASTATRGITVGSGNDSVFT